MRRRSVFGPLVVLVVFGGCQFQASCGGGKTLRMDKAKEFVISFLEREVGQKPASVSCPETVKIAKDASFACTASIGAATATLTIKQDDDQGNVTITSVTGILILRKLEATIATALGEKIGTDVKVTCGGAVRPSTPGDKLTCDAHDSKGGTANIAVTVKDVAGNVSWEVVSSEAATPPAEGAPTP